MLPPLQSPRAQCARQAGSQPRPPAAPGLRPDVGAGPSPAWPGGSPCTLLTTWTCPSSALGHGEAKEAGSTQKALSEPARAGVGPHRECSPKLQPDSPRWPCLCPAQQTLCSPFSSTPLPSLSDSDITGAVMGCGSCHQMRLFGILSI